MSNDISEKDKKDWDNFISSDEKLPNKDQKRSIHKIHKTKSIDLHGYTIEHANKTIEEFINKSFREKYLRPRCLTNRVTQVSRHGVSTP
mgnify:CR=1 FL=1